MYDDDDMPYYPPIKEGDELYYGKCGCGWIVTDNPFMSCMICEYIGCGSEKDLELARRVGRIIEWQKEKPEGVALNEMRDCRMCMD